MAVSISLVWIGATYLGWGNGATAPITVGIVMKNELRI